MFTPSQDLIEAGTNSMAGLTGARILEEMDISYSAGLASDMAPLYERVASVIPSVEWPFFAPYIKAINCLLYTSPSPRDGLLSRMPSSA